MLRPDGRPGCEGRNHGGKAEGQPMKPIRLWGVTFKSHGRRTLFRHPNRIPVLFSSQAQVLSTLERGGIIARAKFDPQPIRLQLVEDKP